jgi:glycosyltransferase involved in cell wall biosynthesis
MLVLHVITALGVGGAERMLLKLLGARALFGFDQRVVAMLPGGAMAAPMRATGARVDELNFLGGLPVLGGAFHLSRLTRRERPDLVHGWLYHGNLGASLAQGALRRQVPMVWSIRQSLPSLDGENLFARIGIALNRVGSGRPDRLLFNSNTSLAQHRARGFDIARAAYIPNGFETETFAPDAVARARWRAEWGLSAEHVVFGMFARYHPAKDHAGFLRAAARVRAVRPNVRFVLAGSGVESSNSEIAGLIAEAGLGGQVHLLGERRDDVAPLLSALDVYVSASAREAFSNSIGEAMSTALPCVVTDVGDSPQVVGDTGRIVAPSDPGALAGEMIAMVDLGSTGRAELGERARQRVRAEFDINSVAQRHADLYRKLIERKPRAV